MLNEIVAIAILATCAIIFLWVGLDLISNIDPRLQKTWRWLARNVVARPVRWATTHVRRGLTRSARWSGRQAWRGIRYSGRQLWRGLRYLGRQTWQGIERLWARLSLSSGAITGTIIATLIFIALVILGNWMWGEMTSFALPSIHRYVWWGLGILVGIGLLVWLLRSTTVRGYATGAVTSGWFWRGFGRGAVQVLKIVLLAVAAFWIYRAATNYEQIIVASPDMRRPRLTADVALPIIAQCESGGRQFNPDGSVVTNVNTDGSRDIGKYQINLRYHGKEALDRGINLATEEGNEAYARELYEAEGLEPWRASQGCWEPQFASLGLVPSDSTGTMVTRVLGPGDRLEGVMPPGWRIDWWGDPTKFETVWVWRGQNKVQIFTAKPGVESTEVKIRIYPCSKDAPC